MAITVGNQMFLGMQDFDFCPNWIKFSLTKLPKTYPIYQNFTQIGLNLTKKFARRCDRIPCISSSYTTNTAWVSAAGGRGPPRIFVHGTNIVDKGLKVLFFGFFFAIFDLFFRCPPPPGRGLTVLFFGLFSFGSLLEIFLPTPLTMALENWCNATIIIRCRPFNHSCRNLPNSLK